MDEAGFDVLTSRKGTTADTPDNQFTEVIYVDARGETRTESVGVSCNVACQEDGTVVARFLPLSWDHLFSQSWDRPACCAGESFVSLFDHRVSVLDVEVSRGGFQGGQRG